MSSWPAHKGMERYLSIPLSCWHHKPFPPFQAFKGVREIDQPLTTRDCHLPTATCVPRFQDTASYVGITTSFSSTISDTRKSNINAILAQRIDSGCAEGLLRLLCLRTA